MDMLPGFIVYNGLNESLKSLAHFQSHPSLQIFSAAYFQKDTILDISENRLRVRRGYLTVIRAIPANAGKINFEISQFGGGEEMAIGKIGIALSITDLGKSRTMARPRI